MASNGSARSRTASAVFPASMVPPGYFKNAAAFTVAADRASYGVNPAATNSCNSLWSANPGMTISVDVSVAANNRTPAV